MSLHKPMRKPKLILQKLLVALIVLSMFSLPTQVFAQDTGDGTDGSDGRAPDLFLPMLSDGSEESADMSAEAEAAYNNDYGDDDAAGKAIFFVADGLRQDMVEQLCWPSQRNAQYAHPAAQRRQGRRKRLADRGAAQHGRRLVQPGDGCLAGRARLDQQHLPHQRPAVDQPHRRL